MVHLLSCAAGSSGTSSARETGCQASNDAALTCPIGLKKYLDGEHINLAHATRALDPSLSATVWWKGMAPTNRKG